MMFNVRVPEVHVSIWPIEADSKEEAIEQAKLEISQGAVTEWCEYSYTRDVSEWEIESAG